MASGVDWRRAKFKWWLVAAVTLLLTPATVGVAGSKARRGAPAKGSHRSTDRAIASARASRKKRKVAMAAQPRARRWHPGLALALQMGGKRVAKR